ncbi:MAG: hypothetical protein QXG65_01135 [Thermoplasmata archaeon]
METRAAREGRRPHRPLGRRQLIALGIIVTFVGIAAFSLFLPTAPVAVPLPLAAVALLCLWIGGILLGRARGAP